MASENPLWASQQGSTLFQRLGGFSILSQITDVFYKKLLEVSGCCFCLAFARPALLAPNPACLLDLQDAHLAPYFAGISLQRLHEKQVGKQVCRFASTARYRIADPQNEDTELITCFLFARALPPGQVSQVRSGPSALRVAAQHGQGVARKPTIDVGLALLVLCSFAFGGTSAYIGRDIAYAHRDLIISKGQARQGQLRAVAVQWLEGPHGKWAGQDRSMASAFPALVGAQAQLHHIRLLGKQGHSSVQLGSSSLRPGAC